MVRYFKHKEKIFKYFDSPKDYKKSMLNDLYYEKKPKEMKYNFYAVSGGIDTESTTISHTEKNKIIVDHCFCYMFQLSLGDNIFLIRNIDDFKKLLTNIIDSMPKGKNSKNNRLLLWCANLSHEWSFLKNMFDDIGVSRVFAKTKRNILEVELNEKIIIKECIGLLGYSLANIAKLYTKTQKAIGDLDYKLIRHCETILTDTELYYCYNDVKILGELFETVENMFLKKSMNIPMTTTGICRAECKKRMGDNKKIFNREINSRILSEQNYNMIRRYGYNGGWCGSNAKYVGEHLHNVFCVDEKSEYPYQMNSKLYPSGKAIEIEPTADNYKQIIKAKKLYYAVITFKEITAKTEHCIINTSKIMNPQNITDVHTVNGKLFSGKNVQLCVNNVDIETLKLLYNLKQPTLNYLMYFEGKKSIPKYLKDNINEHYKRKVEISELLKTEKDKEKIKDLKKEYAETKKKINAHYGMCATRMYKENLEYSNGDFISKTNTFDKLCKSLWVDSFIAYFCTSYARFQIAKYASKFPDIVIQYDTDSLYFRKDEKNEYKKLIAEVEKENEFIIENNKKHFKPEFYKYCYNMGTWEIDNNGEPYTDFLILGAKRYIKTYNNETSCVIAGLPKNTLNKWTYKNGVEKSKDDIYKFVANAVTDTIKFSHECCGKLSSKYFDTDETNKFICVDYLGNACYQKESSYHALLEIGFEFTIDQMLKYRKMLYVKENTPH